MKLKANQNYLDKGIGGDINNGEIVNEVYERLGKILTEEREKILIEAGVVDIIEEEPITINPEDIVEPGEMKLDDTVSVEAKVILPESATATQETEEVEKTEVEEEPTINPEAKEDEVTSTGETKEDLKGEGVEAPKGRKNNKNNDKEVVENEETVKEEKAK